VPLAGGEPLGMAQHLPGRPAQHLPTVHVYCYTSTEELYLSNIFSIPGGEVMLARNAFMEFLKDRYNLSMAVSCTPNNTEQSAQDGRNSIETFFLRAQDQNHKTGSVSETGWRYSGSAEPGTPSSTSPPPAPAVSRPQPAPGVQTRSAGPIVSSDSDATVVTGVYVGSYKCGTKNEDLKLSVRGERDGTLSAMFSFRPAGSGNFTSFRMAGQYSAKRHVTLEPLKGQTAAPQGFASVSANYIVKSHALGGVIRYDSCGAFSATLDTSQSPEF
jgi:hypothetical protein